MAKFCHFGINLLKSLAIFQKFYSVFGNIWDLLWQNIAIGLIFIVVNGQMLKKYTHLVTLVRDHKSLCPIMTQQRLVTNNNYLIMFGLNIFELHFNPNVKYDLIMEPNIVL